VGRPGYSMTRAIKLAVLAKAKQGRGGTGAGLCHGPARAALADGRPARAAALLDSMEVLDNGVIWLVPPGADARQAPDRAQARAPGAGTAGRPVEGRAGRVRHRESDLGAVGRGSVGVPGPRCPNTAAMKAARCGCGRWTAKTRRQAVWAGKCVVSDGNRRGAGGAGPGRLVFMEGHEPPADAIPERDRAGERRGDRLRARRPPHGAGVGPGPLAADVADGMVLDLRLDEKLTPQEVLEVARAWRNRPRWRWLRTK